MKVCTKCKVSKTEDNFYLDSRNKNGLQSVCKKCDNVQSKNYRKENPQKCKDSYKNWKKNNREKLRQILKRGKYKRRSLKLIGSHTLYEWENLKAQYNWTCPHCQIQEPTIKLTEDHIIPLSRGGSDNIENIQPLCRSCNSRKGNRL